MFSCSSQEFLNNEKLHAFVSSLVEGHDAVQVHKLLCESTGANSYFFITFLKSFFVRMSCTPVQSGFVYEASNVYELSRRRRVNHLKGRGCTQTF